MKRYFASGGLASRIDNVPRLSIRRVIWILPSDTVFVDDILVELTNTVSDGKIQITLLILRRGALSSE